MPSDNATLDPLPPKKGYDIVVVKNGKGKPVSQRYVKSKGVIESLRGSKTGRRDNDVMSKVDEAVDGA